MPPKTRPRALAFDHAEDGVAVVLRPGPVDRPVRLSIVPIIVRVSVGATVGRDLIGEFDEALDVLRPLKRRVQYTLGCPEMTDPDLYILRM